MCVDDIRLESSAKADQGGQVSKNRKQLALLADRLAPYAFRSEEGFVIASGACINDLMALPRLHASEINGEMNISMGMIAMLDQMKGICSRP